MTRCRFSAVAITKLYLLATNRYGYGDHVTDSQAFVLRARKVQR